MNSRSVMSFFGTRTARLAASYLFIIMVMSLSFSVVSYNTSSHALGGQLPPDSLFQDDRRIGGGFSASPRVNAFISDRIDEGRHDLLMRLITTNALVLVGGGALSYYLARRTLKPIEDSMEAQSQFISDASHELRTPLTTMQTTNEVALRDKKLGIAEARTVLAQNVEEVEKLKVLTDGLLKLAKQDEDGVTLTRIPVNLQDVTSEAMNRVMQQALDKNISVEDESRPITVLGSQQALVQILVILLDNAIKYSPSDSTVRVRTVEKAKHVLMSVRDEGPGIRPYDLRKIFDRFYRADQSRSNQHVPGNGIGLALAKKIVEQQNGEIIATSTIGKGSVFTIKLPLE
jgi:two-component system sensor histidine kinase CiaH